MMDAIRELKVRAEILHHRVRTGDAGVLKRLRKVDAFRRLSDRDLAAAASSIRRRHCLAVVAAELGFPDWQHARRTLTGTGPAIEFGTLLYPPRCGGHLNHWFVRHEEAAAVRAARGGYLLAYRRDCFVVDRYFIEALGLDPDDPDWNALGFDWVRPASSAARNRLYAKLISALPREA